MTETLTINPKDWDTILPLYTELGHAELNAATLDDWLQRWSYLESHLNEFGLVTYRAKTEDTTNEQAEQDFLYLIEELEPKRAVEVQKLKQKFLAANVGTLPNHIAHMRKRFQAEADLFREENIPLQTEVERLSNEYDKIVGAMTVEIDGETLTIPQANKLLSEPDRALREHVWHTTMNRALQDRAACNDLYLQMRTLRQQIARNAGKASFIEYVWQQYGRFDYTPADCFTFHDAIEHEIVPVVRKWHAKRQQQMGIEPLRPWDLDVDPLNLPALTPFQTGEQLEEGIQHMFERVDPELGQQFMRMRDGYLDLESRQGKAPGGYCGGMDVAKVPYIFMNAVGTHDDVQTMLHEGGHAFHFFDSSTHNDLVWNYNASIEFCEVASMSMELLAAPYLEHDQGGFYTHADANRARAEHLLNLLKFWPYMAVVDAFQHWVYTDAPTAMTAADCDAKWSELWDRFMVGTDWSGLQAQKETGWHRKQHIFQSPLYYVEYGLAQVGAVQVWRNALKDQAKAVADYRAALMLGDTKPLPELFKTAGATFAFDRKTLRELAELIDQHLERLES